MNKTTALLSALFLLMTFACKSEESAPKSVATKAAQAPKSSAPATAKSVGDVLASGTIMLPEGKAAKGKTIFVSIRALSGGPPLAAKRMKAEDFPMAFSIDKSNAIAMGGRARPVPAEFNIKVTLDADGDPMKKSPDDLSLVQKVKRGDKGLKMLLK